MGHESESKFVAFLDGAEIELGLFPEITLSEEVVAAMEDLFADVFEPWRVTIRFKTPKHWRCRGRKRFIKLMMSEGISRNYANWLAEFTRTLMPYKEAWRSCCSRWPR